MSDIQHSSRRCFARSVGIPLIRLLCTVLPTVTAAVLAAVLSLAAPGASQATHYAVDRLARPAAVTTIVVTNTNDSGSGSLRQAIADAAPGNAIVFADDISGTIMLTTGELTIAKDLIITGPGTGVLAVSGSNATRVFSIQGAVVDISRLTIRDGSTPGCGGGICIDGGSAVSLSDTVVISNAGGLGGGIANNGILTVAGSSILNNVSTDTGGGINNTGRLTIIDSTISENRTTYAPGAGLNQCCQGAETVIMNSTIANNRAARHAGGIGVAALSTLVMTNTTISGNMSEDGGGGIDVYGTAWLFNSTVANNTSTSGGGLRNTSGQVWLKNSMIAGNTQGDCLGIVNSSGHNLSGDATCGFTHAGDIQNQSAHLGPLADNGGPTLTHTLLPASPAINGGGGVDCPATDQRGVSRPQGGSCDIGAVELLFTDALYLPVMLSH